MVSNLYGYVPRLPTYMAPTKKTSAELIRELRERRGLTYREAGRLAGLSHGTIQEAERRGIATAQHSTVQALARAYSVSEDEIWLIARGIDPFETRGEETRNRPARHLEVHPDWVAVPVYGTISAGDDNPSPLSDEVAYIPREHLKRRGSDPNNIRTYYVNGACMVSDEARRIEKNYAPGDYVAVDIVKGYEVGDIVAAWWEEKNSLVIKRYKVEKENIILFPLSPGRPSLVLPTEDDVQILGPVVWRGG